MIKDEIEPLKRFVLHQVSRSENHQAAALSKLASSTDCGALVFWELKPKKSIDQEQIMFLSRGASWMDPIIEFKKTGRLTSDPVEAKYVKARDKWFELWDETLYKKSFNRPFLKCITREDGLEILKELHEGACASHIGGRALGEKALRTGYYWPTLKEDASATVVRNMEICTRNLNSYLVPTSFCQMGH